MDALDPARPEHWFLRQIGVLERRRGLLYGVCIGLIAVIAFADYLTGDEVLLSSCICSRGDPRVGCRRLRGPRRLGGGDGRHADRLHLALSDGGFPRPLHVWQALVSLTSNAAVAWAVANSSPRMRGCCRSSTRSGASRGRTP